MASSCIGEPDVRRLLALVLAAWAGAASAQVQTDAEGLREIGARLLVQGEAARWRTEHWKADETSIAREGRGILRIAAAVLRWTSGSGAAVERPT